jgi:hypothetical protein
MFTITQNITAKIEREKVQIKIVSARKDNERSNERA